MILLWQLEPHTTFLDIWPCFVFCSHPSQPLIQSRVWLVLYFNFMHHALQKYNILHQILQMQYRSTEFPVCECLKNYLLANNKKKEKVLCVFLYVVCVCVRKAERATPCPFVIYPLTATQELTGLFYSNQTNSIYIYSICPAQCFVEYVCVCKCVQQL